MVDGNKLVHLDDERCSLLGDDHLASRAAEVRVKTCKRAVIQNFGCLKMGM